MKVIITGATGMVGEGALMVCLQHPAVEKILMVNRKPFALSHAKLSECVVPDFMKLETVEGQLAGYDACFYCAGISSVGMSEADYTRVTYDTTIHFAETLLRLNPGMVFDYVSGAATDGTEKGSLMWARVKGRTENTLARMGFKREYNFRPGFMRAIDGQENIKWYYGPIGWLYPVLRAVAPNQASTLEEVGLAMINTVLKGADKQVLEIRDINALGKA